LLGEIEAHSKAMEATAHVIAKINHLNKKGTDHFLNVLLENRADLAGLPFVMGKACRQSKQGSLAFLGGVNLVRQAMSPRIPESGKALGDPLTQASAFWENYQTIRNRTMKREDLEAVKRDEAEENCGRIAALMQMLAPLAASHRTGLVKHLADLDDAEATAALGQLALFSFDEAVRRPAVAALKKREKEGYSNLLLAGLRHPWPPVARNAAKALVELGRKDLAPALVDLLDEPDPRAPMETVVNGQKKTLVREMVRLNHHRNCLLCHSPGNTSDVVLDRFGLPGALVVGPVPIPGQPFDSPSRGYGPSLSPDMLVRADVTYLRQDFSLMQPVKDAAPWPELQRFDFLVRTRAVTAEEAASYQKWVEQQGPGYLSPQHHAALTALRALTGRDASEPTSKAWRRVLEE
jgi:hypothetical protein